jgi:hypothetical protein
MAKSATAEGPRATNRSCRNPRKRAVIRPDKPPQSLFRPHDAPDHRPAAAGQAASDLAASLGDLSRGNRSSVPRGRGPVALDLRYRRTGAEAGAVSTSAGGRFKHLDASKLLAAWRQQGVLGAPHQPGARILLFAMLGAGSPFRVTTRPKPREPEPLGGSAEAANKRGREGKQAAFGTGVVPHFAAEGYCSGQRRCCRSSTPALPSRGGQSAKRQLPFCAHRHFGNTAISREKLQSFARSCYSRFEG